jgi:hypothetical protein
MLPYVAMQEDRASLLKTMLDIKADVNVGCALPGPFLSQGDLVLEHSASLCMFNLCFSVVVILFVRRL